MRTDTFRAMGCDVVVGGACDDELVAIASLFAEREARFSRFLATSELSRVNASPSSPIVASPAFAQTLGCALRAAALTNGLVDPTVGAAVAGAGYDRDFAALADDPRPATPGTAGRWRDVRVGGRLVTVPPGVVLDLNGVVKGLAVDDALEILSGEGFVSAGGDLAVHGTCIVSLPGGGTVAVHAGGIATSGVTSRSWSRAGERQHHLIDPERGLPSRSCWAEVTVSGITCHAADVAAKAAFLLGRAGPGWLDEHRLPGRFVRSDGAVVTNEAWLRSTATVERRAACT